MGNKDAQKPTQSRLTDRKRNAIVDAAIREFEKTGFDHTRMDRIAEVAGVSKRTVYNHFASKEKLFDEIIRRMQDQAESLELIEYSPRKSLKSQLTAFGRAYTDAIMSDEFTRMVRVALSRFIQSPQMGATALEAHDKLNAVLIELLEAAKADKRIKFTDAEVVANQFTALINDAAFWPQMFSPYPVPNPDEVKQIINRTVALILDHYTT
jgi:TetR/AcrR family transcriptional regulator of autoinduction and epiphytic fitness